MRSERTRAVVRIACIIALSSVTTAFVLSTISFWFVPFGVMDYDMNGDIFKDVGLYAQMGGLREGDRLSPRTSFYDRLWIEAGAPTHPLGQKRTYTVIRHGTQHTVTLSPDPSTRILPGPFAKLNLALRILAFLAFAGVGTFLVLVQPRPLTRGFYLFAIGQTLPLAYVTERLLNLPMPAGFILNLTRLAFLDAGMFAFIAFVLLFPGDRVTGWRRIVLRVSLVYLVGFFLSNVLTWCMQANAATSSDWRIAANAFGPQFRPLLLIPNLIYGQPGSVTYTATTITLWGGPLLIGIVSLLALYRKSEPQQRRRLIWAILGVLLAYSVISLQILATFLPVTTATVSTLWVLKVAALVAPFVLCYAILKHRVVDVSFVVNRAVVYTVLIAVLVIVFESFSWVTERLLQRTRTVEILQMILAIGLAISIQHSFRRVEAIINRWLFKSVHDAQEHLARVASALISAESTGALERLLASEPVSTLKLTAGALFRRRAGGRFERTAAVGWSGDDNSVFAPDDPLVLRLQDEHRALSLTDAALPESYAIDKTKCADQAVPIFSQGALTAIALYGPHANGAKIDPGENSMLANLAVAAEQGYASLQLRWENVHRLSDLLKRVENVAAYDEVNYYLADQLLQTIPETTRNALVACAVIPQPTDGDIVHATGDEENVERLQQLLSGSAVMRVATNGTYVLHPLVRHVLLQNAGRAGQDMLLRCARAWRDQQRYARAAQLYREAGMHDEAAEMTEERLTRSAPAHGT